MGRTSEMFKRHRLARYHRATTARRASTSQCRRTKHELRNMPLQRESMNEPVSEREKKWSAFLARWPLDNLNDMTLVQYSQAGNQDCFVYWLEALTESL